MQQSKSCQFKTTQVAPSSTPACDNPIRVLEEGLVDRASILNHGVDLEERQDNAAASSMVATIQFKNNAAPSSMDATMKFKTSPLLCSALQFHVPRRRQGAR